MASSVMCRMTQYFENPMQFDPSRFDPDKERYIGLYLVATMYTVYAVALVDPLASFRPSAFVFFPFGVGHRKCIGHHFAIVSKVIDIIINNI